MFERAKNDSELLRASLEGSPKAFGVLVSRYQSLVCAITYSATRSVEQSEELAQEVFLRAWRSLSQLQDLGNFRAWLCRITHNTVQNWFRSRRRDVVEQSVPLEAVADKPSEESGPEEAAMIQERSAVVNQALDEIPESLREPLILFYREQKSVREVAQQFGLTENTARQRISRGRSLLRKHVAHMVESTITRSRPGKAFTAAVMVCIAGAASRSSAAAAVASAAQAASAAGKSVGVASLLLGASAKIAAVAAGLALVAGGILAYRYFARAPESVEQTVLAAPVTQGPAVQDRPRASLATLIPTAAPVTRGTVPGTPQAAPISSVLSFAGAQSQDATSLAHTAPATAGPFRGTEARATEASVPRVDGGVRDRTDAGNRSSEDFNSGPLPN